MKIQIFKVLFLVLLVASLCSAPLAAGAEGGASLSEVNPYDLLSRVLLPIASVFSPQSSHRGMTATLVLESMTNLPPELAGSRVELVVQSPDRLLLSGTYAGRKVTLCRAGQKVWISPAPSAFGYSRSVDSLTGPQENSQNRHKGRKPGQESGIGPMVIPFAPQQLVLLPALFQVADRGMVSGLRILDLQLMAELARQVNADGMDGWKARAFVSEIKPLAGQSAGAAPRFQLAGLEIARTGWHLAARIEHLDCTAEIPASTWQPPEETAATGPVLRLTGDQAAGALVSLLEELESSGVFTKPAKQP